MNIKFSELPPSSNLQSNDIFPIVRGTSNLVAKGENIINYVNNQNDFYFRINKILTSENATTTVIDVKEQITDQRLPYHRPEQFSMPNGRGWFNDVYNVSVTKETSTPGQFVTTNLIKDTDYSFFVDRQSFLFLDSLSGRDSDVIRFDGTATRGYIDYKVSITGRKNKINGVYYPYISTTIPTSSKDFHVTSVTVQSDDVQNFAPITVDGFYFDRPSSALYLRTNLECSSAEVGFRTNLGDNLDITFGAINGNTVNVPKYLWPTVTSVSINKVDLNPNSYTFNPTTARIVFSSNISTKSDIIVKNGNITYYVNDFTGNTLQLPTSVTEAYKGAKCYNTKLYGSDWGTFVLFAGLEKKDPVDVQIPINPSSLTDDDVLHLGYVYPYFIKDGFFTVTAVISSNDPSSPNYNNTQNLTFNFWYWPGNGMELPTSFLDIQYLKVGSEGKIIHFDEVDQRLYFPKTNNTGVLNYKASHKAYEGLAKGGEVLEILDEVPGLLATTCGTGFAGSTVRSFPNAPATPPGDWTFWWKQNYNRDVVQVVNSNAALIYQDDTANNFYKLRPGYTAEELKPITVKLPLAALWASSRIDDTSFFQEAFTPNAHTLTFNSATYTNLEDTQRYASDSVGRGKTVTLSTNTAVPVRGVQGIKFSGAKPTFYGGYTIPWVTTATYKWFVVKCVNSNGNSFLTNGKKYFLCINNTNMEAKSILVTVTDQGYQVAADIFEYPE